MKVLLLAPKDSPTYLNALYAALRVQVGTCDLYALDAKQSANLEDFFRHFGACPLVIVKRYRFDAVFSEYALCFRLSDIVKEGCKTHDEIVFRRAVARIKEVIEHVEVVKAPYIGLETAAPFAEFGDKEGEYARFFEHFQRDRGFVGSQHFNEFVAKALDRNFLDDGERFERVLRADNLRKNVDKILRRSGAFAIV